MNVRVERNGPVTTVIIDRPEVRNAVDRPTAEALAAALRAFEADDEARVAVLTGAGGTFCAGADLGAVAEDGVRRNRLEAEGDGPMGPSRMQLEKPLIAAIEGHAVAGGMELALLADMRVMAEDAVVGLPDAAVGNRTRPIAYIPTGYRTQQIPTVSPSSRRLARRWRFIVSAPSCVAPANGPASAGRLSGSSKPRPADAGPFAVTPAPAPPGRGRSA